MSLRIGVHKYEELRFVRAKIRDGERVGNGNCISLGLCLICPHTLLTASIRLDSIFYLFSKPVMLIGSAIIIL